MECDCACHWPVHCGEQSVQLHSQLQTQSYTAVEFGIWNRLQPGGPARPRGRDPGGLQIIGNQRLAYVAASTFPQGIEIARIDGSRCLKEWNTSKQIILHYRIPSRNVACRQCDGLNSYSVGTTINRIYRCRAMAHDRHYYTYASRSQGGCT